MPPRHFPFKVIKGKVWTDVLPLHCQNVELSSGNPFGQGPEGTSKGPPLPLPINNFSIAICSRWLSVLGYEWELLSQTKLRSPEKQETKSLGKPWNSLGPGDGPFQGGDGPLKIIRSTPLSSGKTDLEKSRDLLEKFSDLVIQWDQVWRL
jgi:hypothetical protein